MHAASVNPEPGSNSLKNSILNEVSLTQHLLELFCLAYLLLFEFLIQSVINEISAQLRKPKAFSVQCSKFHVVQFSMSDSRSPLGRRLSIILNFFLFVKGFCEIFSTFFDFSFTYARFWSFGTILL